MTDTTGGLGVISLEGKSDGNSVFTFANDGDRLPTSDGWVGRGWLNESGTNDFLVTATLIPVPAAVWLFGSALGALGVWRRRKVA